MKTESRYQRQIFGVTPCCWPSSIFSLLKGIAYGWVVFFTTKPIGLAWLYWKCWYWPGHTGCYQTDCECKHGTIAKPAGQDAIRLYEEEQQ